MSEADSLWYLRHRDGVEHGPFQLADLVSAAQAGNIAADTCLRHQIHTRAQWVFATRVQPLAQVMPAEAESSAAAAQLRPSRQSDPQPSRQPPAEAQSNRLAEPGSRPSLERPSSVFRGPQPDAPQRSRDQIDASPEPTESIDKVTPTTAIRTQRDAAFPVPRTFVDAVQTLFLDFQFRNFITPWIVKILWAISLLLALLSIAKLGHDFFVRPSLSTSGSSAERGDWEFGPMNEQPLLVMRILVFATTVLLTSVIVLCIRVICEMVIVVFLAGGDVRELRKLLKQPRP